MQIKLFQNTEIDRKRWDKCIKQSNNQLSYAYTWYLDIVSPSWEALISENYEYVMPLPSKRKYGIPYLVQPILTQQLGVFSKEVINEDIINEFIKLLPSLSYELNLNDQNIHSNAVAYPNYILNLNFTYQQISSQYTKNTHRNIDKSSKLDLKIKKNIPLEDFILFYYSVNKNFESPQQSIIEKLIDKGLIEKSMTLFGVYNNEKSLIAGLCILLSNHRLTYLLPISSAEGKSSSAMFFLIDKIIQNNAEKEIIFDFEGSSIEGIARFYKGFGAKNKPYYILKRFRPSFLISKINRKK